MTVRPPGDASGGTPGGAAGGATGPDGRRAGTGGPAAGLPGRRAVLAGAAAWALAACTGLPEETPIQAGRAVGGPVDDAIRVVAQGPLPGAVPRDIVVGFLRASVAFDDDPTAAREFLTGSALTDWTPQGVAIYEIDTPPQVTVTGTGAARTATVVVPTGGALDADGHYGDLPAGTTTRLRFELRQVGGQWRITTGTRGFGALMSRGDFARYASFDITYALPGGATGVVDPRWVLQGPGLVTRLARAIVAEPPAYLQGAVVTGVPEYTDVVAAVSVQDGTATVQLTERASTAGEDERRILWARFVAALVQDREVERVQLLAGGTRLAVDGLPDRPLTSDDVPLPTSSPRTDVALVRRQGSLAPLDASAMAPLPAADARAAGGVVAAPPRLATGWYHVAVSTDLAELAAVGGDDRELTRWRDGHPVPMGKGPTRITRPAYDRHGALWFGGDVGGVPRLLVLPAGARAGTAPTALAVPWLARRRVRCVRVSPDGTRVLVVSAPAAGGPDRLDVAGVQRRGAVPTGLAAHRTLAAGVRDVVDATWVGAVTVAAAGRRSLTVPLRVVVLPLNDSPQWLGEVPRAVAVTSFGGEREIAVVTSDAQVLRRAGGRFVRALDSSELALPGR